MDAKKMIIGLLEYLEKNNLDINALLAVEFDEGICESPSPFVKTYTQSNKTLLCEDFEDGFICEYILLMDGFLVNDTYFHGLYEIIYDEETGSYSYDIRLTIKEINKIINEFYIGEDEETVNETVKETTKETAKENNNINLQVINANIELYKTALETAEKIKNYTTLDKKIFIEFLANSVFELGATI